MLTALFYNFTQFLWKRALKDRFKYVRRPIEDDEQVMRATVENCIIVLQKLKIELPYDLAILLWIYTEKN